MVATNPGLENIAEYLVQQRNINLDLLDTKGRSALYLALECDNHSTAKILADAGASI